MGVAVGVGVGVAVGFAVVVVFAVPCVAMSYRACATRVYMYDACMMSCDAMHV